jgi:hypothetical protein
MFTITSGLTSSFVYANGRGKHFPWSLLFPHFSFSNLAVGFK